MIINQNQIKDASVKIEYLDELGSGFFISKNKILTAHHIFLGEETNTAKILISHKENILKVKEIKHSVELDLSIIEIEEEQKYLPLNEPFIRVNEIWETFGYTTSSEQNISRYSGTVKDLRLTNKNDILLSSEGVESSFDYGGLSGAPIIYENYVVGVILRQSDSDLEAVSISKAKSFLLENKIEISENEKYQNLPFQLESELKNVSKNYSILEEIKTAINQESKWILLTGTPGSGKSINIATLKETEDCSFEILGKYFIKIPNDNIPISVKISPLNLIQWIEDKISFTLSGEVLPKEDKKIEERIERLPLFFSELNEYYKSIGKIGVLIFDGLDEVKELDKFLGVLPHLLPDHIKIILSCTSLEIIPSKINNEIDEENIINVTPLDQAQCEYLILKEIGNENINIEQIQKIAYKSEGHPLYLKYLIDLAKNIDFNNDENSQWVDSYPVIGGNITKYYSVIWEEIEKDSNRLWICLVLSQLRQPITLDDLKLMLPQEFRLNLLSSFPQVKHLILNANHKIEIYHNSFKEFIAFKTQLYLKECNDNIVNFCLSQIQSNYAISNLIHHLTMSNNPEKVFNHCNQSWADELAKKHISPDLVLNDIKSVINLALIQHNIPEIIRTLLLLQRIEFRYDYIFYEYASDISSALISNEQYKESLQYLVRDNTLLVSNIDAEYFLQLLFEANAFEEANVLMNAANASYRKQVEEGIKSSSGVHFSTFSLKMKTFLLATNEEFNENYLKFMSYQKYIKELESIGDNKEAVENIRNYCASWSQTYLMRTSSKLIDIEKVSQDKNFKVDEKWTKMMANSMVIYEDELINYNTKNFEQQEGVLNLVKNIEYLIDNYGYENDEESLKIIIRSLFKKSKNHESVVDLIGEYFTKTTEVSNELRAENSVDINYIKYHNLSFYWKCKGYSSEELDFKELNVSWEKSIWEDSILSLITSISYLEGKVDIFKAKNKSLRLLIGELDSICAQINFSFYQRSLWERSYQIPEDIFPYIYSRIILLFNEINLDGLPIFLNKIIKNEQIQLSLYSEGYRKTLFEIIKQLIIIKNEIKEIFSLVEIWREHILNGVQNRWERSRELLCLLEVYGLLSNKEEYDLTFQEILNSSMGPTWYKESQFALISSLLGNQIKENGLDDDYAQELANILDKASGEMTFQRYVRYNKENFIGSLVKNQKLDCAIEYYKNEILPLPEKLIENAEKNIFDAPRVGDGYVLGARNITEQNAILKILNNSNELSAHLKWGLCEIFTINDDTSRYIDDFGQEISNIIAELNQSEDAHLNLVLKRTSKIISDSKLNESDRKYLLDKLHKNLSDNNFIVLKKELLDLGINLNNEEEDLVQKNEVEKKKKSGFEIFNENVKSKNKDEKSLVSEGLETFQKEKIGIWYNNWSNGHKKAKENLKLLFSDKTDVIDNLSLEIKKYTDYHWSVIDELFWFLESKLTEAEKDTIYKSVIQHFNIIVHPPDNNFTWLKSKSEKKDQDRLIIDFLIWHLNHPFESIRKRTFDVLFEFGCYEPKIIKRLIEHSIENKSLRSTEEVSFIIKKISSNQSELIKSVLEENTELIRSIVKIKHFTVKQNFLELSANLEKIGYAKLNEQLNSSIPDNISKKGEVYLEEDYLAPIESLISELNEMEILNKEFCEDLIKNINDYCLPNSKIEFSKSDNYLSRSFSNERNYEGRYYDTLRHGLNNSISPRIDKQNFKEVFNIINYDRN